MKNYDIIVIGGGHAGVEAAWMASKNNINTLLITNNIDNIGCLSCNPSIGGVGKGCLVREINTLGGLMGVLTDNSATQFNVLNISKSEGFVSTRAQINRTKYKKYTHMILKKQNYLNILQESVKKLIIKNEKIIGVKTNIKNKYFCKSVVITTGTFLNGNIYIGFKKFRGGRFNEYIHSYLTNQLKEFNFYSGRLKTGTPPRIDSKTINFNILKKQKGNINPIPYFSLYNKKLKIKQKVCWITWTNKKTHEIIKSALKYSATFNKLIDGVGPRYCPSIEDKIYKFYKKKKHQIFLEPDGILEYYPNGISTSLPYKIQLNIINSIKGLEKANITRPGYSVEYNFFDPKNLKFSLESKIIKGLFMAGQINGTTGYEEAASQGLIAGLNASLYVKEKPSFLILKNCSYISTMIDELIKNGIKEPYRIFTSKFKNKFKLTEKTIDIRLIKFTKKIKIINIDKLNLYLKKKIILNKLSVNNCKFLKSIDIMKEENIFFLEEIKEQIKIILKYNNYKNLQNNYLKIINLNKNIKLSKYINYFKIKGLSNENSEKLNKFKPNKFKNLFKISNISNNILLSLIKYSKNY